MNRFVIRTLSALLSAVLLLGLCACGSSGNASSGSSAAPASSAAPNEDSAADSVVLSVAHSLPESTPEHQNLLKFQQAMETATDGAISVQLFPNGTLGGDATNLESVQNGNIIMTFSSTATEANYVPECEVFDIPFLFSSKEQGRDIMRGGAFVDLLDEKFQDVGMKLVGATAVGFRWLTCNKAVNSIADLNGIKIRTMENPNHIALWNSLGANATPISGSELFTALQQGTVDGQENPISNIYNAKIYEVNSYAMDTRHILNIAGWVVNKGWYDGLSDDHRAIFDEQIAICIAQIDQDADSAEAEQIAQLSSEFGMTILELSDSVRDEMRAACASVEGAVHSTVGDELTNMILEEVGK